MNTLRVLLVATCLPAITAAGAATTVYTDQAIWAAALAGPFQSEDFSDSLLNDGVSFVSSESGHINPALGYYQDVLASQSQNEPTTTWQFTPDIRAFGGYWTLGGPGGSGSSLQVYVEDATYVGSISNSYGGAFWGFVSDSPLTSVKLIGGSGAQQQNYQLDEMVYAPVPVPAAAWLFASAILGLIGAARDR